MVLKSHGTDLGHTRQDRNSKQRMQGIELLLCLGSYA